MTRLTAPWLNDGATRDVCAALAADGAQVLFVGGCVRNTLLGIPASDIDIATDALPETVTSLAHRAGIKAIPTGIDHGTVTLIRDRTPFEVTTFRRDVETDGRKAKVVFSEDVREDAARRDFTMNAIYARPDGTLLDPLGGLPDLQAHRVRFIGDASARIREDYLRSLRYFRFHAFYGDAEAGFDPEALDAIASNLDGLERLSRERVGAEMKKLLSAPDPAPSLATMAGCGMLARLLPGADDRFLAPLVHLEAAAGAAPDAIRRLAALGGIAPGEALRLSKAEKTRYDALVTAATGGETPGSLGYRLGEQDAIDALLLRAAMAGQPWSDAELPKVRRGAAAVFPVTAADLMPAYQGPALGKKLARLQARWIASDFRLIRDDLLSLPD